VAPTIARDQPLVRSLLQPEQVSICVCRYYLLPLGLPAVAIWLTKMWSLLIFRRRIKGVHGEVSRVEDGSLG